MLLKYRVYLLLPPQKSKLIRFIKTILPKKSGVKSRGESLRDALQTLGPVFIKFGQMISTRRDLVPEDIASYLETLQDRVTPFPAKEAREIIERNLASSIELTFSSFSTEPLASASVAQVHAATLIDGKEVVVKVIRPGIDKIINDDLDLMIRIAKLIEKHSTDGRRLRLIKVLTDYRTTILDELDLMREAANTVLLKRNFKDSNLLYVPEIYWDLTSRNVMVEERIYGTPINRTDIFQHRKVNMKALAERGLEIFFTQVFEHSFFHADMHPGNVFVNIDDPENPTYCAVDFGIVGTLDPDSQIYLAQNLVAFFNRDYRAVAKLHVESGWVPPATQVNEFESSIRTVCEPIFEKPLGEISFGIVLIRLFETARRFQMEVQPQLILLQKTLLHIEGLGRELYPQLDLWKTGKPFLDRWIKNRLGPQGLVKEMNRNLPRWIINLPKVTDTLMTIDDHILKIEQIASKQTNELKLIQSVQIKENKRIKNQKIFGFLALLASFISLSWANEQINLDHWPFFLGIISFGLIISK